MTQNFAIDFRLNIEDHMRRPFLFCGALFLGAHQSLILSAVQIFVTDSPIR